MRRLCFVLTLVFTIAATSTYAKDFLPEGRVEVVLGTGTNGWTGDGGPAIKAQCGEPFGLAIGPDGALYVCEESTHVVRRVDLKTGLVSTVAGNGTKGYSGDGGSALKAQLNEPYEISFDSQDNLYFVERLNHLVRKVDAKTGIISTVAGTGTAGFSGDGGKGTEAQMNQPHSLVIDAQDQMFVCDIKNHRVRQIDLKTGMISTWLGTGKRAKVNSGVALENLPLNGPRALCFRDEQHFFLALREGNAVYRIDREQNQLIHLAGVGGRPGRKGDGGLAIKATLGGPKGVATNHEGYIFLADTESQTIRYLTPKGYVQTLVGTGKKEQGTLDSPTQCGLARPHGVCVDAQGNVYIGDSENYRVLRWTAK